MVMSIATLYLAAELVCGRCQQRCMEALLKGYHKVSQMYNTPISLTLRLIIYQQRIYGERILCFLALSTGHIPQEFSQGRIQPGGIDEISFRHVHLLIVKS